MSGRLAVIGWLGFALIGSAIVSPAALAQDALPPKITSFGFYSTMAESEDDTQRPLPGGGTIPTSEGARCLGWKVEFEKTQGDDYITFDETLVIAEPLVEADEYGNLFEVVRSTQQSTLGSYGKLTVDTCIDAEALNEPDNFSDGSYILKVEYDGKILGELNFNVRR